MQRPSQVVVLTAFGLDEYLYAALRNGSCGFLLKRSGPALLIEGIRAAVAGDMLWPHAVRCFRAALLRLLRRDSGKTGF